jgi:P-type E1-E2 ATPase
MTIELNIPGRAALRLDHLVLDVNGTLAVDGQLIEGVRRQLGELRDRVTIHLLTADTFGRQREIDQALNLTAVRLRPGGEPRQKAEYVLALDARRVVSIGQGANDAGMLRAAALGIAVVSTEGLASASLTAADVLAPSIGAALDLLLHPMRLVATLRE